jgi:MFS family permease
MSEEKVGVRKTVIVMGLLNILVALGFGRFLFSMLVPNLRVYYGLNYTQIGVLASSLLAGYLVFSYLGGIALHRFPKNRISFIALLILSGTFAIYSTISNYIILITTSFLMGGGAATVYMSIFPTISERCNENQYGITMGGVLSGAGIGILLVSGIASFYQDSNLLVPYVWIITFCLSIIVVIANTINNKIYDSNGVAVKAPSGLSFYRSTWLKLLSSKILLSLLIAYFFYGFSYASFLNYIFSYISELENGVRSSGTILWAIFGASSIFSSIFWGKMFDRFNQGKVISVNYIVTGLAILMTLFPSSRILLITGTIIFGMCFFGYITTIGGYIILLTGPLSSVYMGKLTLIHTIGQIIGVSLGGVLRDQTGSFRLVFLFSLIALILSLAFFLLGRRPDPNAIEKENII